MNFELLEKFAIITSVLLNIFFILWYVFKVPMLFKNFQNRRFKNNLEKDINMAIKEINQETALEVIPKIKLQIVDANEDVRETDREVLVFVKKEKKPYVKARVIYLALDKGFLKDSRKFIGTKNVESVKYSVGKLIITKEREDWNEDIKETLKYFERLIEKFIRDEEIVDLIGKHELLIRKRLFKTIFLQELYALGERLVGKIGSIRVKEVEEETIDFLNFLWDIARKEKYEEEYGKEPPLDFNGKFYKVGLVLVKRPEAIDLSPHVYAIKSKVKSGRFLSIYILGWGRNASELEEFIGNWLSNRSEPEFSNWNIKKIIHYKVKFPQGANSYKKDEVPGLCIVFANKKWT